MKSLQLHATGGGGNDGVGNHEDDVINVGNVCHWQWCGGVGVVTESRGYSHSDDNAF